MQERYATFRITCTSDEGRRRGSGEEELTGTWWTEVF
jgi:hypothetical protein